MVQAARMAASNPPLGTHAFSGVVRAYVPSTLTLVQAMARAGSIGPAPVLACAVTPALRAGLPDADVEELEYAAMSAAARGSLRLLAADSAAPRRRVVLVVDVPGSQVAIAAGLGRGAVRIDTAVPLAKLASVHVDDQAAWDDVRAAVLPSTAAPPPDDRPDNLTDDSPDETSNALEDHELLWYAAQELPDLLDPRGSMNG